MKKLLVVWIITYLFGGILAVKAQSYAERRANELARSVGAFVIEDLFDGGINGRYEIINYCFSDGCDWVKFRLTFNGNIITSNFYALTVTVGDNNGKGYPVFWCDNFNEKAWSWWIFKGIVTGMDLYNRYQNSKY